MDSFSLLRMVDTTWAFDHPQNSHSVHIELLLGQVGRYGRAIVRAEFELDSSGVCWSALTVATLLNTTMVSGIKKCTHYLKHLRQSYKLPKYVSTHLLLL
jgi:hypothetical protein